MKLRWLMAFGLTSALTGGLAAAALTRLASGRGSPSASPSASPPKAPELDLSALEDDPLIARVESLERAVRALERRPALPRPSGSASSPPPSAKQKALVDDPVFEAAVADVMERVAAQRSSERDVRREERRAQQLDRWATELGEKLKLTPAQRSSVVEIRSQMMAEMQRSFEGDAGAELSREQRRARSESIRSAAEAKLARALDSRQLAAYEALDPDLKLFRARRPQ